MYFIFYVLRLFNFFFYFNVQPTIILLLSKYFHIFNGKHWRNNDLMFLKFLNFINSYILKIGKNNKSFMVFSSMFCNKFEALLIWLRTMFLWKQKEHFLIFQLTSYLLRFCFWIQIIIFIKENGRNCGGIIHNKIN